MKGICSMAHVCKSEECHHAKPHNTKHCDFAAPCGCWPNDSKYQPRVRCKPLEEKK